MAALSSEIKTFIVRQLACYDTPSTVADLVKEEFGVVVTRQQVENHDPTKKAGATLAKKWVDLFNKVREKFIDDISDIPIAHKAVRLRRLDRMALKAEGMKNLPLAGQFIEQAAKEVGEAYTNRRQVDLDHSSKDGSMTPKPPPPAVVSPADVAEAVKALIG